MCATNTDITDIHVSVIHTDVLIIQRLLVNAHFIINVKMSSIVVRM